MDPEKVTREIFWNVPPWAHVLMYVLFLIAAAAFTYGIWWRVRLWRKGEASPAEDCPRKRIARLLQHGIAQVRIWRSRTAGFSHASLFWAFVVLALVTTVVAIEDYGIAHIFYGSFYLFVSLAGDLFGVVLIVACLLAIARRKMDHRFEPPSRPVDVAIIWCILLIGVTGFLIEGFRIAETGRETHAFDSVAFVGWTLAGWLEPIGRSASHGWHRGIWIVHMVLTMALIAAVPYTKLRHICFAPVNLLLANPPEPGKYPAVSIEQVEESGRYGIGKAAEFNWRQLLSYDSCTQCVRCQSVCPAYATDKPLSPMKIVLDIASVMGSGKTLPGETITTDALWACTSCRACVQECPVLIDQLGTIVEMRRHLVGEGEIRGPEQAALRAIEGVGNPWGLPPDERDAWAKGLDVPTVADEPKPDVLFWVGCAGSYDRRCQKVSQALVKILKAAGVKFAILGNREMCTGDPARRMGDEFTYQAMVQTNVETLGAANPKRIVTACPHCFNTLKNEYPDFGAHYSIVHHTQFIQDLIRDSSFSGRRYGGLKLKFNTGRAIRTAIHDACYLGRHNDEYGAPRASLRAAQCNLTEVPRSRDNTFCCGAGGGRMWMEETIGTRINRTRWDQLMKADPELVAVSCPFCMTMLSDAAADQHSPVEVKDIAEIVAEQLA